MSTLAIALCLYTLFYFSGGPECKGRADEAPNGTCALRNLPGRYQTASVHFYRHLDRPSMSPRPTTPGIGPRVPPPATGYP